MTKTPDVQCRTPDHISEGETITIDNALLRWRIIRSVISKLMRTGRLQSVKLGGRCLIDIRIYGSAWASPRNRPDDPQDAGRATLAPRSPKGSPLD